MTVPDDDGGGGGDEDNDEDNDSFRNADDGDHGSIDGGRARRRRRQAIRRFLQGAFFRMAMARDAVSASGSFVCANVPTRENTRTHVCICSLFWRCLSLVFAGSKCCVAQQLVSPICCGWTHGVCRRFARGDGCRDVVAGGMQSRTTAATATDASGGATMFGVRGEPMSVRAGSAAGAGVGLGRCCSVVEAVQAALSATSAAEMSSSPASGAVVSWTKVGLSLIHI